MIESYIRAIAGSFVLASLALGYLHSPYWHLFTAFVGMNLLQSAVTGWCPMESLLARLGVGSPRAGHAGAPLPVRSGDRP